MFNVKIIIFIFLFLVNSFGLITQNDKAENVCPPFTSLQADNNMETDIMKKPHNYIGYEANQKINNLTFIKDVEPYVSPSGQKQRKALFRCFCGNEFEAQIADVKRGDTKSCGCLGKNTTHGLTNHPIYRVWQGMKQRCYYSKDKPFHRYGGRGIKVCDEWRNDFKKFYDWAILSGYKKGLEIDRINNDGNYEPKNCRFITRAENNQNRSTTKLNWDLVQEIRNAKLLNPKITQKELGIAYGVARTTIGFILNNKLWVNNV